MQDPEEPWTVSHCSGLELGADGLTKPLQGQAFTRFLGLIGMAEDGEISISKVVGPSWTSSTTASTGFNTALEGVGAAVIGVGALMDSEPLVLGGLAMVAVSLYRQRHGVPQEQEGFDLHHGGDLLPGVEHLAEASEPQLKGIRKKEEKSLKTTRLAKRPQKAHKSGQPPKGNLDESAHPPHPQSRASTAEGSKENLGCNGSQSFFPGYGGVAHVPGCPSTDRARPCASYGVESSRPPKGALQEQSVHVAGGLQSVHEVPRVSALRCEEDPGDPIEDDDSEADHGVPFPHEDPHGNAYLQQLGRVPPHYKAPPVQWMQQHAPKAALPKARPKRRAEEAQPQRRAEEAQPQRHVEEAQPKQSAEVLQSKQRAEAFLRAAERGSLHQAVRHEQQQQQGASASSSTDQQGGLQQQRQGPLLKDPREDDRLEDSSGSEKGRGSGLVSASQKMSPNRKGYPQGSTMSSETQNMSTTTGGTSLGHVAGDLECFDDERVAVLTSLRPGSNIDGQHQPALRFFAVMSDGGEDRGDRGRQKDRDDRRDRGAPGKLIERCPGKPKPKRVSLKPAPSLVTLRPASQASRVPDDGVHYVEGSSQDEEKEGIRRVVLDEERGFSSGDDAVPVRTVQTQEGQASSSVGPGAGKPEHGEGQLHEAARQPGAPERDEVKKDEGPKLKKYRRVRVKKQAPQLEREVKEMQSARKTRNERMACLRLLQQERQERQEAVEPPGQQALPESKEPQPRTPSPSSVDWKAAEEETKKQFAEAKAAGRRILSYEEWDKERKEKNEKMRQETLRKSWLDREIARRALHQERGATREAVLRSTTSSASGPLTDDEWVQMQQMMKRLPPAPEKPKQDEEQPQDKKAKTVQKETKHGMPPPDLPAPPPHGYAGVWRGGCCPGFRWQGGQPGQNRPYGPQGQQGFWPGCGGQPQQVPPGGLQGFHPGLQGQAPAQQSMSLDLGPVRYRSPEELAEATAWLERQRGGPEVFAHQAMWSGMTWRWQWQNQGPKQERRHRHQQGQ